MVMATIKIIKYHTCVLHTRTSGENMLLCGSSNQKILTNVKTESFCVHVEEAEKSLTMLRFALLWVWIYFAFVQQH